MLRQRLFTAALLLVGQQIVAAPVIAAPAASAQQITLKLKNGDTLKGVLVPDESTEAVTILLHPVLGRLSIPAAALIPQPPAKPWKLSVSGGLSANNTDDDLSAGGTFQLDTSYSKGADKVALKGRATYEVSRDQGETASTTDTNEGEGELRYTRALGQRLDAYATTTFNYDTLNTIGTDVFVGSAGLGYDLIKNTTTTLNVSLGPAVQQIWGGPGCEADPVCGQTFGAATARAQLEWKPSSLASITVTNRYTGAFINGIATNNTFSVALKIFPMGNQRLFTSLNGQTIFNELQSPKVNNSVSMQLGVKLD